MRRMKPENPRLLVMQKNAPRFRGLFSYSKICQMDIRYFEASACPNLNAYGYLSYDPIQNKLFSMMLLCSEIFSFVSLSSTFQERCFVCAFCVKLLWSIRPFLHKCTVVEMVMPIYKHLFVQ